MNQKILFRIISILIVLILLFMLYRTKWNNPKDKFAEQIKSNISTGNLRNPSKTLTKNSINLPGCDPIIYNKVEDYILSNLAQKYNYPLQLRNINIVLKIYTNNEGEIVKITRNEGHYNSVSRRGEVTDELGKIGYQIKKLGNNFFNLSNRDSVYNIIYVFDNCGYGDFKFSENLDDKTEIEIIPVTFLATNTRGRLAVNKEMAGLLWNHKRAYINMEWQQDERYRNIRLEDCITSHWSLYTIEYKPSEPPDLRFSDYTIDTGKSAGVFLPELRVTGE